MNADFGNKCLEHVQAFSFNGNYVIIVLRDLYDGGGAIMKKLLNLSLGIFLMQFVICADVMPKADAAVLRYDSVAEEFLEDVVEDGVDDAVEDVVEDVIEDIAEDDDDDDDDRYERRRYRRHHDDNDWCDDDGYKRRHHRRHCDDD